MNHQRFKTGDGFSTWVEEKPRDRSPTHFEWVTFNLKKSATFKGADWVQTGQSTVIPCNSLSLNDQDIFGRIPLQSPPFGVSNQRFSCYTLPRYKGTTNPKIWAKETCCVFFFFFRGSATPANHRILVKYKVGPLLVTNEVITPTNGLTNRVDGVMTPINGVIGSYL